MPKAYSQSQIFISEKWAGTGGESAIFHHNVSKTDTQRNVYVAGSTINSSGNNDIIIQKYNRHGDSLWTQTYNGSANMEDMAADVFIDDSANVYVTGTVTNSVQAGYDLCVLKYNSSGALLWDYTYNNSGTLYPYDAGTAITGDNNGNIFVTGGSFGTNTMADFVTIRLSAFSGNDYWTKRYDYDELNDLSAKIVLNQNEVIVSGGSQINTNPEKWELATISYNTSNGNVNNVRRTTGNATEGVDEVYDLTVDNAGNIYVAGAVKNVATGYDVRVYKLDDELNIIWEKDYDGYEEDDKAHGIKVDGIGNIYVTGYTSHPTQGHNYLTLKLSSNDSLLWKREYNGEASLDDEAVQLVLDDNDRVFITGELHNGEYSDYVTVGYYSDGRVFGQAIFEGPAGLDDSPTSITTDLEGNLIVTGQTDEGGGQFRNRTVKYGIYDKVIDPVIIDSVPSHNANELLIRFDRSVMNYDAVDNKAFTAGQLSEFVKPQVIDAMNGRVPFDFKKLTAYKIYIGMTTGDSLSTTRLGDTVKVDDFWATLSVYIPEQYDLTETMDSLNTLDTIIRYSHLNPFGFFHSTPNDPIYNNNDQTGLSSSNHGINMEEAGDTQKGSENVKVGIYDTGINWRHEDFGDGTQEGTKIENGHHFLLGTPLFNLPIPDSDGHGTALAGIAGALSNNDKGITGIAGGDVEMGNTGCNLYSWDISTDANLDPNNPEHVLVLHSIAAPAIVYTSISTPNWGDPMDIQNHSWGSIFSTFTLRDAVRTAFKNHCIFVASSGNSGEEVQNYPASYLDEHIVKTGANNSNGVVWSDSDFGYDIDLLAPGTFDTYSATDNDNNNGYSYQGNGTSLSAAHVSGCVALMLSEHNWSNTNHNYPNNLAAEDIEAIISNHANDIGASGYDAESGFGILNCGESVSKIALPEYCVKHYLSASQNYSLVESGVLVVLDESINNWIPGAYIANKYEVTFEAIISLEQSEQLIDAWPRFSSSKSYSQDPLIYDRNIYDFTFDPNGQEISVECVGYSWQLTQTIGGVNLTNAWVPHHPSDVEFAYSFHLSHLTVSVQDQSQDIRFELFPNPSRSSVTVQLEAKSTRFRELNIKNIAGSTVLNLPLNGHSGRELRGIDITMLTSGLYFVEIVDTNGQRSTKKLNIVK